MPRFLFARHPELEHIWPFVQGRLVQGLEGLGSAEVAQVPRGEPLGEHADLASVDAIALFGGRLTERCLAGAPALRAVGCNTDNTGGGLPLAALRERGIPVIDTTRAWGQSVAEVALLLALAALRRLPQWHAELAAGVRSFEYEAQQYCDATGFANGELGAKRVGVIGLGQIGGRVARWCVALGRDASLRQWSTADPQMLAALSAVREELSGDLGVPAPDVFVPRQLANANREFVAFVEADSRDTAHQLAIRYSPQACQLYKLGAVWGYSEIVRLAAPDARTVFAVEIRHYAQQANLPDELWRPMVAATPRGAVKRDPADSALTDGITKFLTGQP